MTSLNNVGNFVDISLEKKEKSNLGGGLGWCGVYEPVLIVSQHMTAVE